MALIFCDGFDHYGSDDITKKWTSVYGSYNIVNIVSNESRTGANSLKIQTGNTNQSNINIVLGANQILAFGFALKITNHELDSSRYFRIVLYDSAITQIMIYINTSLGISVYRGSTLLGSSESAITNLSEWFFLEGKVYIHDTEGYVTVRKNGEVFYELTGIDTKNGANAYCNIFELGAYDRNIACYIDDLYIDDTDFLGDIKVETLYPSGAGTTKQWDASAGDNYACVDETSLNSDTDYISTSIADEIDTYAFGNLTTTAGTIYGVQVNMIARKDDAGSRSIAPVVRPVSTDRIGTTQSIGDSYMDYTQMYTVNPEDSAAWEIADVNGAEFGIKLIE